MSDQISDFREACSVLQVYEGLIDFEKLKHETGHTCLIIDDLYADAITLIDEIKVFFFYFEYL